MTEENKQPATDLGKIFGSAVSGVAGMMNDLKAQIHEKIESYLAKMDLVKREEFEVLNSILKEKNESLQKQLIWNDNSKNTLQDSINLLNDQQIKIKEIDVTETNFTATLEDQDTEKAIKLLHKYFKM